MAMLYGKKESLEILEKIEEHEELLTEWERTFIQSLSEQVGEGFELSVKQRVKVGEVYERLRIGKA